MPSLSRPARFWPAWLSAATLMHLSEPKPPVCDTRWPLIGLTGLVIATSTGQGTLAAHLFTGAAPVVLAGVIQPAFALLSLGLLGWALRERLKLERTALTPSTGGDAGDVCTSCRPLFPTKTGASRGPST